ncbi:MAG: helix-turn-helix domain-containing protein [Paludibacteraceae bacterium]
MKTIIGSNLKTFRMACGYTAQVVADFLGIQRSAYANYEAGSREMPLQHLEKVADLFGCELDALLSENVNEEDVLVCAFRADDIMPSDAKVVADFKGIVKSYLKMQRIK